VRRRLAALKALCIALSWVASSGLSLAGGNCAGTSTGFVPLIDLPPALYRGFEGGLYPGGTDDRPAAHEITADRFGRLRLLDAEGRPDPANGRIVHLSVGMSNTAREFQKFMEIALPDPGRNLQVTLVNGAQGGWSADELADPTINGTYWAEVGNRLAAAGVTPAQVQAVWLKQADARPNLPFPDDARKLQTEMETIVRDVKARFPNAAQLYLASRIYAGYATSTLNPEPFAYQSGFAVKWIVERQIQGEPSLNPDPESGSVVAPWVAWGPYLWADGLVPRSDGLVWECVDFETDGTHPSESGRLKVAQRLLGFFKTDAVASRWFADCAPADPAVFAAPPRVLGLRVERAPGGGAETLIWDDLDVVAGEGTAYDVVAGSISDLVSDRGFGRVQCGASALPAASFSSAIPDPSPGDAVYFVVRGRNACGSGTYAGGYADPGPRADLDAASPCL
jgi:hypothetical protein